MFFKFFLVVGGTLGISFSFLFFLLQNSICLYACVLRDNASKEKEASKNDSRYIKTMVTAGGIEWDIDFYQNWEKTLNHGGQAERARISTSQIYIYIYIYIYVCVCVCVCVRVCVFGHKKKIIVKMKECSHRKKIASGKLIWSRCACVKPVAMTTLIEPAFNIFLFFFFFTFSFFFFFLFIF